MGSVKSLTHDIGRTEGHGQRRIGSGVLDLCTGQDRDDIPDGSPRQSRPRGLGEGRDTTGQHAVTRPIQRLRHRLLSDRPDLGQSHSVGGQYARMGMQHDRLHAQGIGDQTGVLAPRPAETVQHVTRHVMTALDRDGLDGAGHVVDGDGDEALGEVGQ